MTSLLVVGLLLTSPVQELEVEHRYVDNDGVKIHVAVAGEGHPVVLLHGFPDYWYTWRGVMAELQDDFLVAAVDLRGYNRSDKPDGVEAYQMRHLVADVKAVVDSFGTKVSLVGHDWGAAIAWNFAMRHSDLLENLVIGSVPHPAGFMRELSGNKEQQSDSQYARDFQKEGAHESLTAEGLASWVSDPDAKERYVEAFRRSSFEGMLAYYKANYPKSSSPPDASAPPPPAPSFPKIPCPVLVFHGLEDRALHAAGHNGTWEWIDGPTTLLMVPGAGHFVHHDAPDIVIGTIHDWLLRSTRSPSSRGTPAPSVGLPDGR